MLFHHNGIYLEINNRKIANKSPNTRKLDNVFLSNPWIKEEVSGKVGSILR